jgi:hypothetical protein
MRGGVEKGLMSVIEASEILLSPGPGPDHTVRLSKGYYRCALAADAETQLGQGAAWVFDVTLSRPIEWSPRHANLSHNSCWYNDALELHIGHWLPSSAQIHRVRRRSRFTSAPLLQAWSMQSLLVFDVREG